MYDRVYKIITIFVAIASPSIALAAASLLSVVDSLIFILQAAIPILIGLAVVMFLYGLLRYLTTTDENTRKEARNVILYGIITLFVMVAMWGLVYFLANTLGIRLDGGPYLYPNTVDL